MSKVMFNLKDAFRYSSHISQLSEDISQDIYYSSFDNTLFTETHTHKKSEANHELTDETIEKEFSSKFKNITDFKDVIIALKELRDEKVKIMKAIEDAKKTMFVNINGEDMSIDVALQYNSLSRNKISNAYDYALSKKEHKTTGRTQGYMLNEEKNQVPFYYEKEVEIKTKFDRVEYKKEQNAILEEADNISRQIDELNEERVISFEPKYSFYDTVETILSK